MTEQLREQAQYRKGKTPIVSKYQGEYTKLFSAVAGRGFLSLPGFVYDAVNGLELLTKMGLSDLNMKILSETIDRELKQTGIDYGLEYKAAALAWEINKQVLMVAWEAEYAEIKRGMASDEEALSRLAIAVSQRSLIIISSKTAIELAMEAYKKTLAELDSSTSPYEVQMANGKLLTAQKKATIIPILQTIVTKEQALLVAEQQKTAASTALINAEHELALKKQTEIGPTANLTNASEALKGKIIEEIATEQNIAAEKLSQLAATQIITGKQVEETTTETEVAGKQLDLIVSKRTLDNKQFDDTQDLISHETEKNTNYRTAANAKFGTMMTAEEGAQDHLISDEKSVHNKQNTERAFSVNKIMTAESDLEHFRTTEGDRETTEIAKANAAAVLTAQLLHLIGP